MCRNDGAVWMDRLSLEDMNGTNRCERENLLFPGSEGLRCVTGCREDGGGGKVEETEISRRGCKGLSQTLLILEGPESTGHTRFLKVWFSSIPACHPRKN